MKRSSRVSEVEVAFMKIFSILKSNEKKVRYHFTVTKLTIIIRKKEEITNVIEDVKN